MDSDSFASRRPGMTPIALKEQTGRHDGAKTPTGKILLVGAFCWWLWNRRAGNLMINDLWYRTR
jgi:hypothetical protein